jgi:hypothetical protein
VLAIDFSAYPKLSGKLDLSSMDKLQTVDISGTAIERATLGTNTALTTFYAKNSGLLTLNFSECTAIQTIDCSNSSLQALTLPDQKIESVHCENNYLTFASLPTGYKIADYSYAPQKDAFFIAQINVDVIQIDTKVNMTSYAADTITWYREDGSLLDGIEEVKSQVYTFSTVAVGDYVYAVMTSDAFPELTLTTDLLLIDTNDRVVWYYFLGCVVVFFILIFIARYLAAKRQGVELTTDKYTDSLHDKFEALIERISDKLRPLADRISKRKKK